ncbi:UTP11-like, U3 small nucleolar ribonucleoprotein [Aspergillus hancockii]|nr:UTP11-like, U3 small nucleolar ribonucleoprotein [Aspergillus hancockii]
MSSMRNAVHRRQHRERGQLAGREKWGILEKHKDYSLRAKDYNVKKAKIKRLEEKARDRNPDEFAFGMMSQHSQKAGKHGSAARDSAAARGLSHDAIKLLKTQDAGYLRTVGERVRRQMEKLEQEIRLQEGVSQILGENKGVEGKKKRVRDDDDDDYDFDFDEEEDEEEVKPKKVVFVDDKREQRALKKKSAQDSDDQGESDGESFGELKRKKTQRELEAERQALADARRARKIKKRAAEARQSKLKALQKQYTDLTAAERELDWQRGRMDNTVGGTNKNGIKWKIRERKK